MDNVHDLMLIGLSHRSAPMAVRERYAIQADGLEQMLRELSESASIKEVCALSTCNRTEILLLATGAEDPLAAVRRQLFRNLDDEHLYEYRGVHAIIHLFRVAGGIDSLVVGESEILGQLKYAFDVASSLGTVSTELSPLLRQALQVGKRVRNETELGQGTLSIARVGVDLASRVFGGFGDCRVLIVGAGDTARLVARHFADGKAGRIDFVNRTLSRAESLGQEFGGSAFALDDLPRALRGANIVVCCIEGQGGVLGRDQIDRRELARRNRPLLVIDLSVPRAASRDIAELHNLLYYDLDAFQPVVDANRKNRDDAAEQTSGILVAEVHKFLSLRTYAAFSPAIGELRGRFDDLREEILDEVTEGQADAREIELAHRLATRLLALSLEKMKDGARHARSEAALDREYQRFLENL